ncbi:Nop14-like protein [Saitoella complicata NRRL Y-17804]|uniref:Nop14-like protein n=1 Tax=Saitoella complicata (strain BCRC 22490 / CBS 7301 / JCM 7358 / NBRC 10748 / NRRL Y-17804) TaxID=698492 RepID=A0A0E9NPU6_SAICN|nr:Nop14-like protein [Saitoella complicata NRRL Y-17804]ODQ52299.1 Nop14-like protein [Saitoella complicata NRRL Y-17804]GAO51440.1 hypothetical protein G7K_5541-t1 [Saitoella complicata NRRL Y-17804]
MGKAQSQKSTLARLKSSLSSAGITGPSVGKKQKKKGPAQNKEDREKALNRIRERFQPYEIKTNKVKYDIGGRKQKGQEGRPGLSKAVGEENRKKELLPQLLRRNKVGGLVDKRFGENNANLTPEEKMLERFTREKQKKTKGSMFNLEDEDSLTHFGQSLADMDDLNGPPMGMSEDEDEGPMHAQFGGFSDDDEEDPDQPERKKSKREVMQEVIAKSKLYKFERQKQQDEDDAEREALDAELDDIRMLLAGTEGTGINPERQAMLRGEKVVKTAEDVAYDAAVREMVYDRRARPSDRTKTEDELAEEEAEKLQKLEASRLRRMRGEESDEDEGGNKRNRRAQADDLEDDFVPDDEEEEGNKFGLGRGIEAAQELLERYEDGEDDDEEEDDDDEEMEGSEDEDDDDQAEYESGSESDMEDLELDEEPVIKKGSSSAVVEEASTPKPKLKKFTEEKPAGLAYTYPCPRTYDELAAILSTVSDTDIPVVVHRIRVLHHPKLHPENKAKLLAFVPILLDYTLDLAKEDVVRWAIVEGMAKHLHGLGNQFPEAMTEAFRDQLKEMRERFVKSSGLEPALAAKVFPRRSDLVLFTILGTVFPTSDHHHMIVTPAALLMGQFLAQTKTTTVQNLATGLFVATLFVQYQRLSKRIVPEALNFACLALAQLAPTAVEPVPGTFPVTGDVSFLAIKQKSQELRKMKFEDAFVARVEDEGAMKASLVGVAVDVITQFADLWKGAPAFVEIFDPCVAMLDHYLAPKNAKLLPAELVNKIQRERDTIAKLCKFARQERKPLAMQAHRPVAIATYLPKFEEHYSLDKKSYDPDRERAQLGKLQAEHRREKKGAIRELRKDNAFLAREQIKTQKAKDQAYEVKMRKVHGSLQVEQAEKKEQERMKRRMKNKN